jgi:hypothetical protein
VNDGGTILVVDDVLAVRDATPAQDLAHRSGIGPPLPKTNAWRSGRFEISGDG